jgi:hypothetical protein
MPFALFPGYVTRLLELSRLQGSVIPSEVTNGYLREAVRTYVLGLPQPWSGSSEPSMLIQSDWKAGPNPVAGEVFFLTFSSIELLGT